jgi:tetratricopeptide (TPR) repeat protein
MNLSRMQTLEAFLRQNPRDPFTHYAIALEYESLEQFDQAIEKFCTVLTIDPNYVPAYHQLGLLYIQLERTSDAIATLGDGIRVAERNGDAHARSEMQEVLDELQDAG